MTTASARQTVQGEQAKVPAGVGLRKALLTLAQRWERPEREVSASEAEIVAMHINQLLAVLEGHPVPEAVVSSDDIAPKEPVARVR